MVLEIVLRYLPGQDVKVGSTAAGKVNSDVSNTRGCAVIDTDMLVQQYILGALKSLLTAPSAVSLLHIQPPTCTFFLKLGLIMLQRLAQNS